MQITQELLQELFSYNKNTGELIRLPRDRKYFKSDRAWKIFNSRFANKTLSCIDSDGYYQVNLLGKVRKVHRLIWLMNHGFEANNIDHINGKRTDNRLSNLRSVTMQENSMNLSLPRNNKSGVIGVCYIESKARWLAQIEHKTKHIFLGYYSTMFDAVCARKSAESNLGFHCNHGKVLNNA